jgi:hypothetical protein
MSEFSFQSVELLLNFSRNRNAAPCGLPITGLLAFADPDLNLVLL